MSDKDIGASGDTTDLALGLELTPYRHQFSPHLVPNNFNFVPTVPNGTN